MKLIYIFGIFLAAYALISYGRFLFILRTNTLPAISQRSEVLGQGEDLIYVAAGDSTSVGVGASTIKKTYAYKLFVDLAKQNRVHYIPVGKSGAKTTDVLSEQMPKIVEANPDIVTLSIGANDVTHLRSNRDILKNYKDITDQISAQTHAQIYLTNIPILKDAPLLPLPLRKFIKYKSEKINQELSVLETDRVHIVPIYSFGWDQFSDIRTTFAPDQFHPSDTGYENWTNAFLTIMRGTHD